jgi:hypothetical protein
MSLKKITYITIIATAILVFAVGGWIVKPVTRLRLRYA